MATFQQCVDALARKYPAATIVHEDEENYWTVKLIAPEGFRWGSPNGDKEEVFRHFKMDLDSIDELWDEALIDIANVPDLFVSHRFG